MTWGESKFNINCWFCRILVSILWGDHKKKKKEQIKNKQYTVNLSQITWDFWYRHLWFTIESLFWNKVQFNKYSSSEEYTVYAMTITPPPKKKFWEKLVCVLPLHGGNGYKALCCCQHRLQLLKHNNQLSPLCSTTLHRRKLLQIKQIKDQSSFLHLNRVG